MTTQSPTQRAHTVPVDDMPIATFELATDESWHDGPGWYYWDDEYRDEGSVGAFVTRAEAEEHAREAGYRW